MNNDLISIVVPIYNTENYLKECIESIIKQDYKKIEIILIDDGSKDSSGKICDEFANIDKRIKVFHKNNSGVSAARNLGIEKANGKYLSFVDSDDILSKSYISDMYSSYITSNLQYVIYNFSTDKDILKENNYKYQKKIIDKNSKDIENVIIKEIVNSTISKLYNLEIIKSNKIFFEEKLSIAEDFLFNMIYLQFVDKFFYSNKPIYWYRNDTTMSLSRKYNENKFDNLIFVNKKIEEIYKNNKIIYNAIQAIKIKNLYSCYKDRIVFKKDNIDEFVKYANNHFIGKLKVPKKFIKYYIEEWFYNRKMFKMIYKIIINKLNSL